MKPGFYPSLDEPGAQVTGGGKEWDDWDQFPYPAPKIGIWFADEARIGQKNKITRRWTKRGTRPSAPRDQRYARQLALEPHFKSYDDIVDHCCYA
jgi:hypothetical protein